MCLPNEIDVPLANILHLPSEIKLNISSFTTLGDMIKVHTVNRQFFSQRDEFMRYVLTQMEREETFKVFSRLIITGNRNILKWFQDDPRLHNPSDANNDGNDENDDSNAPFLTRTLNNKNQLGNRIGAALHVATYCGHGALVDDLITLGASVKAKAGAGSYGVTALHRAALQGQKGTLKILLDRGADIGAKDDIGGTALHWAAEGGRKRVLKSLLFDHGANIDAEDYIGRTALHWAARRGKNRAVVCLLDLGADIEARTGNGETAHYLATKWGYGKTAKLLQNHSIS